MTTFAAVDSTTDTVRRRSHAPTVGAVAATLLAATVAGLLAGVVTSYAQELLPAAWSQVANSGAVWTVVAFVIAAACASQRWAAVTAGALALVAEVAGYYAVASPLRGVPTTNAERALWGIAALWIGPAAGLAAWGIRRGEPRWRLLSALAMAGLVAGEGLYEVRRLGYDAFGRTEIVIAAVAAGAGMAFTRAGWGNRVVGVGVAVLVACTTYAVYAQTILM